MPSLVRRAIVLVAVTPLIVLLVGAAQAGAAVVRTPPSPFSERVANPCNGEPGTLSGTRAATIHVIETPDRFMFQGTFQTDETFTPDDPASPVFTGHGVIHQDFIDNHAGGPPFSGTTVITHASTDVFSASGAHVVIHDTAQTVLTTGDPVIDFDRPVLVCMGV